MPRKKFDLEIVEGLGKIACTHAEMAAVLGCSTKTISRHMERKGDVYKAYKKGKEEGNQSLRRKQWDRAMDGDRTMLIWLGKQRLDQKDRMDSEIHGKDGGPVDMKITWPGSDRTEPQKPAKKQKEKNSK